MRKSIEHQDIHSDNQLDSASNQSLPYHLMAGQIQELYRSKLKLKEFIKNLEDLKNTGLHKSVLDYFNKINERLLTPENVLRMTDKRVEKMLKNKKIKKNWSGQDVAILVWILSKYIQKFQITKIDQMTQNDWKNIAELIPGSTADRCMFKWLSLKKFNLANYRWEQAESNILAKLVHEYGLKDWKNLSQKLYKLNPDKDKIFRNAKQCRQHWSCYLNPKLKKGPWQTKQDKKLLECILSNNGQKKWSQIAKKFHGRTQNALKNRYNLIMEKQKKISKNRDQLTLIKQQLSRLTNIKSNLQGEDDSQSSQEFTIEKLQQRQQIFDDDQNQPSINGQDRFGHDYNQQDTGTSPIKIVKANYQDFIQFVKENCLSDPQQLIPTILTNNNQFYFNTIYGSPF